MKSIIKHIRTDRYQKYLDSKGICLDAEKNIETENKKCKNLLKSEKLMKNQIEQDNPNERKIRHLLIEMGVDHKWQKPFSCDKRYICVDFYLEDHNIVIEVDGESHKKREQYDLERTQYLKKIHGVSQIIRITNKQIATQWDDVQDVMSQLLQG